MRKYWLVGVIENDCIVTQVRVYNEISPESEENPLVTKQLHTLILHWSMAIQFSWSSKSVNIISSYGPEMLPHLLNLGLKNTFNIKYMA